MTPMNKYLKLEGRPDVKLGQYVNCKTRGVIYALICSCKQVYVGQPMQELQKLFQKHLPTIALAQRDKREGKTLTSVAEHFLSKHGRKTRGLTVVGLERVSPDCRSIIWIRLPQGD